MKMVQVLADDEEDEPKDEFEWEGCEKMEKYDSEVLNSSLSLSLHLYLSVVVVVVTICFFVFVSFIF
jgi:hypothetical protein